MDRILLEPPWLDVFCRSAINLQQPAAEMPHDTTVDQVRLGDRRTKVIASVLYRRYSKRRYLKFYRVFNRFAMTKQRGSIWLGPTGCGKTGRATSFLLQAIDRGYRGYFVTFPELIQELFQSLADRSDRKVMRRYLSYDCLVIDEVGYVEVEPAQVGQFFTLMHKRHRHKTTILTSNLGFGECGSFLKNPQLTAALSLRDDRRLVNRPGEVVCGPPCQCRLPDGSREAQPPDWR